MTKEEIEIDKENTNHPQRYCGNTEYECYKVLEKWTSQAEYEGWLKCSAIKYLCRLGKKDDVLQDLKKTAWFINQYIEHLENKS